MRLSFPTISKILLTVLALACALPGTANAYWHNGWHGGVYVGGPVYWGPQPVIIEPAPVVVEQAPVVVSYPLARISLHCQSGSTVTVHGNVPTDVLFSRAVKVCQQRDAGLAPPPPIAWNGPAEDEQGPPPNCREYQSKVSIGGKPQQAYGTACQQPDGSWQPVK